ncbi:uncharacterized protein LOC129595086 [Paramacrobiotus metropolitanus]|uniref:uncharacterized protein LOC129595086 n=1 Tax=Paramacrobiotus metropolitanus TaxID=2943436 RepID=UPI0024461ABA|nr:uncharacterized protein LOC129595086 [Paramacrobiotus metropolitanus]
MHGQILYKITAWVVIIAVGCCANAPIRFESECNAPTTPTGIADNSPVTAGGTLRTDMLSAEECVTYHKMPCGDDDENYCPMVYARNHSMDPLSHTYVTITCQFGSTRTALAQFARNVSITSANRAVVLKMNERNDTEDPLHSDVIGPIRTQIIELDVHRGATPALTTKIYNAGAIPNLVMLQVGYAKNLVIKRHDFSGLPSVRWITFTYSSVKELEPYTFTDLAHLKTLSLEGRVAYNIDMRQLPKDELESVKRLHCDCSFAWYRNFLKRNPHLIQKKRVGEAVAIGTYASEEFPMDMGLWPDPLTVNCAAALDKDNVYRNRKLNQYSYNTSCNELAC